MTVPAQCFTRGRRLLTFLAVSEHARNARGLVLLLRDAGGSSWLGEHDQVCLNVTNRLFEVRKV